MEITLKWGDLNFGETEQRIYRSTATIDPANLPAPLATVAANVKEYVDTTVVEGTTYFYRVAAVDPASNLYVSDELQFEATYQFPIDMFVYWTGDNVIDSTVVDEQGNYNATIFGTVGLVSGQVGQAFNFSGSANNYVRAPHAFWANISEFTISCWIKTGNYGTWLSKIKSNYSTSGIIFFRQLNDQADFRVGNTTQLSTGLNFTTSVRDNIWHHVVACYSSTAGHKLYLDGQLDASSTETIGALDFVADSYWNIGRDGRSQDEFSGSVDDLRFYEYELSASEILELYNAFA